MESSGDAFLDPRLHVRVGLVHAPVVPLNAEIYWLVSEIPQRSTCIDRMGAPAAAAAGHGGPSMHVNAVKYRREHDAAGARRSSQ